jgi:hypothetical protein
MSINQNICKKKRHSFIKNIANLYKKIYSKNPKDLKESIEKWVDLGVVSPYIKKLFRLEERRDFPIFWAGFWLEDPSDKNPVQDMLTSSKLLNWYMNMDTSFGKLLKEQNEFWSACSDGSKSFGFGDNISIMFLRYALRNDPKNIGLFLNKETPDIFNTWFFKLELNLINEHYQNKPKVNVHIFNLKTNCKELKKILSNQAPNINFICYNGCPNLEECVKRYTSKNKKYQKKTLKK